MDIHIDDYCGKVVEFVKSFFNCYLAERDFAMVYTMLDKNVSWFGTGEHEVCKNPDDAKRLLMEEKEALGCSFKILELWCEPLPMDNEYCGTMGGIKIECDNDSSIKEELSLRYSMLCHITREDGVKLFHCHLSAANKGQTGEDFIHEAIIRDYNILLEETLAERTKTLSDKTMELETLTNNISGGIELCDYSENFHILYVNEGFYELTGYNREEIIAIKEHMSLVHPDDVIGFREKIQSQVDTDKKFSLEYRIVRKNGEVIWVIDRGAVISTGENTAKVQSVLIDITEQKEAELALKLSEKRYEIAMSFADINMFEYNVVTKDLILFDDDSKLYGVSNMIKNGPETFVKTGIIEPSSVEVFLEMYRKIHSGEPFAGCYVRSRDKDGVIHDFQLNITNVFDERGRPIRGLGVKKNVTQLRQLQREKQYGITLAQNQIFIYEINVITDEVIAINDDWAKSSGVLGMKNFTELKNIVKNKFVAPEFHEMLMFKLSKENLMKAYADGERLIYLDYRKNISDRTCHWFRKNVNIIQDEFTGDIIIRCYISDINDIKMKEIRQREEQKLYERLVSSSSFIYEVNLTQDKFLSGHEKWGELFGINQTSNYSDMMEAIEEQALYPEDRAIYISKFSRKNVMKAYDRGETQIVCDYRRPNEQGVFIWVRCTLHLYEDTQTGDIMGSSYIVNIDDEKKREIELTYKAEHDTLTNLFDKSTVEKKITEYLATRECKQARQVFFIIDIDYFKMINDNFGHAFGDVILSQVASRLRDLFREDDILGRVGGDEFIVLMKNVKTQNQALAKAQEICEKLTDTFTKNGVDYKITLSIGIAIYNEHGNTYDELYRNSDTALYISKENGRNQYTVYNENMSFGVTSIKAIDENELLEARTFDENMAQYVFNILYETNDKKSAINSVLELVGKHFGTSRAYVFEYSYNGEYMRNTFEWCNTGIKPMINSLQDISNEFLGDYKVNFNSDGIFFMSDIHKANENIKATLEPQDVKSMLQFSIVKNKEFMGFIGFDQCEKILIPSKKDVSVLQNISNILAVFILEMRGSEQNSISNEASMSIINGLDSYAYVCSPNTYKVVFANSKTKELTGLAGTGGCCYEYFWNRSAPCDDCPMKKMVEKNLSRYSMELYNSNLHIWVKATSSWIDWIDGERMCLIDSTDITEYKK